MKLLSLKILGENFRSLQANKLYEFNVSERKNKLSTKCFAGLNGSGKSNMLELISEIFYFIDYSLLVSAKEIENKGRGFGFEIEYLIEMSELNIEMLYGDVIRKGGWMHIKIVKPIDKNPEFSLKPKGADNIDLRTVSKGQFLLLPKNIIAYSSGRNEILSNPFYKLKYHYFNDINKSKGFHEDSNRMFFIDDAHNYNIFISNYLLGDKKKLKILKKACEIKELNSFRITINLENYNNNSIDLLPSHVEVINKLKACATCWDKLKVYGTTNRSQIVMDFLVDEYTLAAFNFHFEGSPLNLFKGLYKLDMLNLLMQRKKVKDLVNNPPKWLNISEEIPTIDPNDQIFRLEKIFVEKIINIDTSETKVINYKSLSDGEHQLNEVVGSMMLMDQSGCLMLYDEPDTHFNPKWRGKLMQLFLNMSTTNYDSKGEITKIRDQEVIITTHSPFAISDSYREDVYVFEKKKGEIKIENPNIKTFGASIGMILENIFNRDISISNLSNSELELIKTKSKTKKQILEGKEQLIDFGESIEKFDAISYLFEREEEIENKKATKK